MRERGKGSHIPSEKSLKEKETRGDFSEGGKEEPPSLLVFRRRELKRGEQHHPVLARDGGRVKKY